MFDWLWEKLTRAFWTPIGEAASSGDERTQEEIRLRAAATAPVIWLIGKAGAGKSSIISAVTGDSRAEVGNGFRPCTQRSEIYDWPTEAPILRFLDTRGLGESDYNPTDDIVFAEAKAHVILAVMAIHDPNQHAVVDAVTRVREQHPEWPVIVAQSHLHSCYPPGARHPPVYPYRGSEDDDGDPSLHAKVRVAFRKQRLFFSSLSGSQPIFVPLDFTLPEDAFEPAAFGLQNLKTALVSAGVDAVANVEAILIGGINADITRKAQGLIWGYAVAAGASGGVPVPLVGVGGLLTTIGLMLRALAGRFSVAVAPAQYWEFAGALGGGVLLGIGARFGIRELIKVIPVYGNVAGAALNATAALALTIGIGQAACKYLGMLKSGQVIDKAAIRKVFEEAMGEAFRRGPHDD